MIEALLQAERLLVHGMVDQAEQIYASAIELDPRNAIAAVGLARVALERGDDELAYHRARTALEIDPQNAAALRLSARLAEIFAARGASGAGRGPERPADGAVPAAAEARPSEQAVFTRNPSMADRLRMEQQPTPPESSPTPPESSPTPPEAAPPPVRRPGLLRRLLGE